AEVDPAGEGEVRVGVAPDVEPIRILEDVLVVVRRRQQHHQDALLLDEPPADLDRLERDAGDGGNGGVVAEELLDGRLRQRGNAGPTITAKVARSRSGSRSASTRSPMWSARRRMSEALKACPMRRRRRVWSAPSRLRRLCSWKSAVGPPPMANSM